MSGGIFPGRPFSWNIKCIVFTLVIAGGYWYLPPKNLWVLIFLLWLPYVALAWYDYSYNCQDKMQPTLFPLGRYVFLPFKPDGYKREFDKMSPDQIKQMDNLDHLVTWSLLVIGIGWYVIKSDYSTSIC
ncbi:MAG: hypothetical protein EBU90_15550 [Proteobacteria bacterium]|nr:hypothetical protein [Pseudomonadota bacterium]NBP13568.1 hypothetical protein [bacterium]